MTKCTTQEKTQEVDQIIEEEGEDGVAIGSHSIRTESNMNPSQTIEDTQINTTEEWEVGANSIKEATMILKCRAEEREEDQTFNTDTHLDQVITILITLQIMAATIETDTTDGHHKICTKMIQEITSTETKEEITEKKDTNKISEVNDPKEECLEMMGTETEKDLIPSTWDEEAIGDIMTQEDHQEILNHQTDMMNLDQEETSKDLSEDWEETEVEMTNQEEGDITTTTMTTIMKEWAHIEEKGASSEVGTEAETEEDIEEEETEEDLEAASEEWTEECQDTEGEIKEECEEAEADMAISMRANDSEGFTVEEDITLIAKISILMFLQMFLQSEEDNEAAVETSVDITKSN